MHPLRWVLLCAISTTFALVPLCTDAAAQTPQPAVRLRIASKLGIETEFAASETRVEDEFLGAILARQGARIPLQIGKDTYVSVPVWDLTEATASAGNLVATLANGSTLRGLGIGSVVTDSGRTFSLNSISRLVVADMSKDYAAYVSIRPQLGSQLWQLTVGKDVYLVRNPRFAFKYYSSSGYSMGGSDRIEVDGKSFWLKQGPDTLEAPLESFVKIQLTPAPQSYSLPIITVVAPNGTTTKGQLVLKHTDDAGSHDASRWAIIGYLDGLDQTRLLVKGGSVTLERAP